MFLEVCLFSAALHAGSDLYKKLRDKKNKKTEVKSLKAKNSLTVSSLEASYHQFMENKIDPLFGDARNQQLKAISSTEELSEQEKEVNRRIGIASANLGLAVICQVFYPPLLVSTIPGIFWLSSVYFKEAWRSLFKEHRISIAVLDSLLATLFVISGYFFAAVLANFLFGLSRKLLSRTKDSSRRKLVNVFGQNFRSVWVQVEGTEIEIPFEQLQAGNIVVTNAGEMIPADGTIMSGTASVDQRILTGESQPSEKGTGDQVFASTIVLSGKIHIRTEQAGQETVAAKIGDILSRTTEYKTSFESKAERIVDQSTLPTLVFSGLALPVAGASGALAIILSSIAYNMRILAPLSTLNFLRVTSHDGILIKDGSALEGLTHVDTVIFDKTGTLTLEQPRVANIYSYNGLSDDALLTYAAAAEYRQTHPVAKAILAAADERKLNLPEIEESRYDIGYGIRVLLDDQVIRVGSSRFMEIEGIDSPAHMREIEEDCGVKGYSLVMVSIDDELSGAIELHPVIRSETGQLIRQLRQRNISTCIISGDHEHPTQTLARELGIDHYFANTLPEHKAEIISQLQKNGKTVCFVGDGINDSIALKKADVSVSLRGAATVATDTAQIVLMDEKLTHLNCLLDIARKFKTNQKRNLMITIIPGVICTGGVFLFHFGIYTSMILFFGSLGVGIGNSLLPLTDQKDMLP